MNGNTQADMVAEAWRLDSWRRGLLPVDEVVRHCGYCLTDSLLTMLIMMLMMMIVIMRLAKKVSTH